MATSAPQETSTATNLKTRSTHQKVKSDAFQLKKMHFTGNVKDLKRNKKRRAKK